MITTRCTPPGSRPALTSLSLGGVVLVYALAHDWGWDIFLSMLAAPVLVGVHAWLLVQTRRAETRPFIADSGRPSGTWTLVSAAGLVATLLACGWAWTHAHGC